MSSVVGWLLSCVRLEWRPLLATGKYRYGRDYFGDSSSRKIEERKKKTFKDQTERKWSSSGICQAGHVTRMLKNKNSFLFFKRVKDKKQNK